MIKAPLSRILSYRLMVSEIRRVWFHVGPRGHSLEQPPCKIVKDPGTDARFR